MSDPNGARETTSTPMWLKAVGIVVLVAVVVFVVVMFIGGGHTPQPHGSP